MRAAANVDIALKGPSKNVSALWSASNLNLQPYKKTWNYFTENVIPGPLFLFAHILFQI